jgi:hypothetical protein
MHTLIFRLTHKDLESSSSLISNVLSLGLKSNKNQTITSEVLTKIEFGKEQPTETLNNISLILDLLSIKWLELKNLEQKPLPTSKAVT